MCVSRSLLFSFILFFPLSVHFDALFFLLPCQSGCSHLCIRRAFLPTSQHSVCFQTVLIVGTNECSLILKFNKVKIILVGQFVKYLKSMCKLKSKPMNQSMKLKICCLIILLNLMSSLFFKMLKQGMFKFVLHPH